MNAKTMHASPKPANTPYRALENTLATGIEIHSAGGVMIAIVYANKETADFIAQACNAYTGLTTSQNKAMSALLNVTEQMRPLVRDGEKISIKNARTVLERVDGAIDALRSEQNGRNK